MTCNGVACGLSPRARRRRSVLRLLAALGLGLPRLGRTDVVGGDSSPPQQGDRLVFAAGDRAGTPIAVEDLAVDAQQTIAFPQDPKTGSVRNGTRLNQVLVVRLDPASLSPETQARAAEGVVAYSGVCSHAGCDVTDWYDDVHHFKCPCHESEFDPSDGARVVAGPAPWQLAALPLEIVDGKLAVAGPFEGRVGFLQPGQDPFGGL
jgi:rieske iron-sulfur protein